jgi:hypothetical protein
MDLTKEQRVCIKFCANFGKIATEALVMIRQHSGRRHEPYMGVEWHARFGTGRISTEDDHPTGRPISCKTPDHVAKLQQPVPEVQRRTIQDLADEMGIGIGACQRILTAELGMHPVAAKFLTRILTVDQKQQRNNVYEELRQIAANDATFLSRVITGDESWIYGYDPETMQ